MGFVFSRAFSYIFTKGTRMNRFAFITYTEYTVIMKQFSNTDFGNYTKATAESR